MRHASTASYHRTAAEPPTQLARLFYEFRRGS